MKLRNLLLGALLALSVIAVNGTAGAAPVNFDFGNSLNPLNHAMTPPALVNGQHGEITNSMLFPSFSVIPGNYGFAQGQLGANTKITFTYTFTTLPTSGGLFSMVNTGLSSDTSLSPYLGSLPQLVSAEATPLTLTTLTASAPTYVGQTIITNLSSAMANFKTMFVGKLGNSTLASLTYNVSSVPLPAALPLFALGLAGLAGYSRKKKASA